jgi:TetR/AcrR family transcriptional repressor of mexJK operon
MDHLPPRDPKGGRPTREMAARLHAHILAAALDQFVRLGVDGASMEGIASAANVSKRTLYARFASKTDLLISAIEYGVAKHLKPISASIPEGAARERLRHTAARMLDASLKPEVVRFRVLATWIADHEPTLHGVLQKLVVHNPVGVIQSILEEGVRRGEFRIADSYFTATFLFDALVSMPRNRILDRLGLEDKQAAKCDYLERTIDLILSGLTPRE